MSSEEVVGVVATQIMVMGMVLSMVLLFMGIGILVLIHVCIVGRGFSSSSGDNVVERSSNNRCNTMMSVDEVEKLPCFDFEEAEETDSSSLPVDCAVCLENFRVGDKCRLLPLCKHIFHADCVDSWLLRTPICPICRTNATDQKSGVVLGGEEHIRSGEIELRDRPVLIVGAQLIPSTYHLPNFPSEPAV